MKTLRKKPILHPSNTFPYQSLSLRIAVPLDHPRESSILKKSADIWPFRAKVNALTRDKDDLYIKEQVCGDLIIYTRSGNI